MKVNSFIVNLTSEDPGKLITFYGDVVGLPRNTEIGEDAFDVAGATLVVDGHSETKGAAKEPQRVLINFFVDDLQAEQTRLEEQGVRFIRTAAREEWGGTISTFLDPDGNYCQLIEFKPQ
jgi:predicted enzyme related to lactoylglutathione lyase